jgi:hypothetical protein
MQEDWIRAIGREIRLYQDPENAEDDDEKDSHMTLI